MEKLKIGLYLILGILQEMLFATKVDYLDVYPLESVLDVDFFQPLSSEYLIFITKTIVLIKTKDSYLTLITKTIYICLCLRNRA